MTAKIGLIGGLGWPATLAYYEAICRAAEAQGLPTAPEMTIESLDMSRTMADRGLNGEAASWNAFDKHFIDAFERLEAAGCDLCAVASVTPHKRQETITAALKMPFVGVVDAIARQLTTIKRPAAIVLGTEVTMRGALFDAALANQEFDIIHPSSAEIDEFSTLLNQFFYVGRAEQGRTALMNYIEVATHGRKDVLVLLACTDLAPTFREAAGQHLFDADGYQMLDVTAAHVDAIVKAAFS